MTTIGSLFTGYGGLDLAAALVFGARTAWTSDIERGPSRVIAERFPDAPNLGDITAVDWAEVEPVDIITGGSPCQDISAAGRRAGMTEGTRSNLWVQMREGIRIIQPSFVIWENVRGAHSAGAHSAVESESGLLGGGQCGPVLRATGRVLGDLADLGFDAEWVTLPASEVGAPHKRERVFVLAWPAAQNPMRGRGGRWPSGSEPARSDDAALRSDPGGDRRGEHHDRVELLPTPCAQPSGNSPEDHLRKKPGRDRVTDLAIIAENGLMANGGRLLPTPRASDGEKGGPNQRGSRGDLTISSAVHRTDFGVYSPAVQRWETVIGRPAPAPTSPGQKGRPRLSATFVEWMMGLPAGWVTEPNLGLSRVQQLRLLGNGVVPQQAELALRLMLDRIKAEAAS